MTKPESAFDWITFIVSFGSVAIGIVGTLLARAFKEGKKESAFEGQDKLFDNMLTNAVKEQVAIKEEFKRICDRYNDVNIRLTKIETMMAERDRMDKDRDVRQRRERDADRDERERDRAERDRMERERYR